MSAYTRGHVTGYLCATCGTPVPIGRPLAFRCPAAPAGDSHHVLHPVVTGPDPELIDDPNPFVRYGRSLAWWAFAQAHGMSDADCLALTREVADGFSRTPCGPDALLSERLGADVWVKTEVGQLGGSHKARHLVTILLHLRAAEELGLVDPAARRPLAIASCGNAAIAASTLAHAAGWPIQVYVPMIDGGPVIETLTALGAEINRCPRRDGESGDPAVLRFREAVAGGAIPFSVQGPENGLCLDGGRTIGWELREAVPAPARVLIQVGGGAFAACAGWGLGPDYQLDTVQTEGGAPLDRAWRLAAEVEADDLGRRWSEFMTPWADPHSLADGILDDETYDWQADFDVMRASAGRTIVVSEDAVERAWALAKETGVDVSPTGSAGLAALLPTASGPSVQPGERVAIVLSGVNRG